MLNTALHFFLNAIHKISLKLSSIFSYQIKIFSKKGYNIKHNQPTINYI